jgi:hypothetical protein
MQLRYISLLLLFGGATTAAETENGFDIDDALVPADEIRRGGPPRDGIPAIDNPVFIAAADAEFLRDQDRVLGIELAGVARAYAVRILNYHEIVNDEINGRPLVITFCPLCGTGMAFDASRNGSRLVFGVSGLLYNSDMLLYDRNTESLWSQIMSTAISGQLKGVKLTSIPLAHTSWRDWRERHPKTEVLSMKTGFSRDYRTNPYPGYDRSSQLYFSVDEESPQYPRKTKVLGVEINGKFKAYPFTELRNGPAEFADEFDGRKLVVHYDEENETARILDQDGVEIATLISFWFAWYAFHPDTEIHIAN